MLVNQFKLKISLAHLESYVTLKYGISYVPKSLKIPGGSTVYTCRADLVNKRRASDAGL